MDFREAKSAARQQRSKNLRYKGRGRGRGGPGSSEARELGSSEDENEQNEGDSSRKRGGRRLDLPSNAGRYEDSDDETGALDVSKLSAEERAVLALQPRSEGNNYEELLADRYDEFLIQGARHHMKESAEPPWEFVDVLLNTKQSEDDAQTNLLSVDLQALGQSLSELPLPALLCVDTSYCLQIVSSSPVAIWGVDVAHEDGSEWTEGDTFGDGDERDADGQALLYTDCDFSEQYETVARPVAAVACTNDVLPRADGCGGSGGGGGESERGGISRQAMSTAIPSIESHSLIVSEACGGQAGFEASLQSADSLWGDLSPKPFGPLTALPTGKPTTAEREPDILDDLLGDVEESGEIPHLSERAKTDSIPKLKNREPFKSVSTPMTQNAPITSRHSGGSNSLVPNNTASQFQAPSDEVEPRLNASIHDVRHHRVAKEEDKKVGGDEDFDAWMDTI